MEPSNWRDLRLCCCSLRSSSLLNWQGRPWASRTQQGIWDHWDLDMTLHLPSLVPSYLPVWAATALSAAVSDQLANCRTTTSGNPKPIVDRYIGWLSRKDLHPGEGCMRSKRWDRPHVQNGGAIWSIPGHISNIPVGMTLAQADEI
jgi:hypothetical protein